MTRVPAAALIPLLAALLVLGCGERALPDRPMQLLTGEVPRLAGRCFGTSEALLVADDDYGTALSVLNGQTKPVAWPPGFTAIRVGQEVHVLDRLKKVVAVTGQSWRYWSFGSVDSSVADWVGTPLPASGAEYVCRIYPVPSDGG
jgi:hypothetical protein